MRKVNFWAMDLEMEQPSNEIISIGVSYDYPGSQDAPAVRDSKNFYITPSQPLSDFIKELTGLKDSDFDWNKSRKECLEEFKEHMLLLTQYCNLFREPITWGQGDVTLLVKTLREHGIDYSGFLGRRCIDAKTIYQMQRYSEGLSISSKSSLNSAMSYLKIKPVGTAHNSESDALNTHEVFSRILERNRKINSGLEALAELIKD